jgi:integrase/recombinase XerD
LWAHVNLNTGKILIYEGKGEVDRYIWVSDELIEEMQKWKERQTEEIGNCDHVFTTTKGKPLQNRYVQRMVKRYSEKAGIEKNVTPHKLRHTFATDFYKETRDIMKTQKALGHADVSTTMIYTHIVDSELEEAMKNFRRGSRASHVENHS